MRVKSLYNFGGLIKDKEYDVLEVVRNLYLVNLGDDILIRASKCFFKKIYCPKCGAELLENEQEYWCGEQGYCGFSELKK